MFVSPVPIKACQLSELTFLLNVTSVNPEQSIQLTLPLMSPVVVILVTWSLYVLLDHGDDVIVPVPVTFTFPSLSSDHEQFEPQFVPLATTSAETENDKNIKTDAVKRIEIFFMPVPPSYSNFCYAFAHTKHISRATRIVKPNSLKFILTFFSRVCQSKPKAYYFCNILSSAAFKASGVPT